MNISRAVVSISRIASCNLFRASAKSLRCRGQEVQALDLFFMLFNRQLVHRS
ncbi:MAG: hypothetical protein U0132_09565 [Gemmatimonadaceae bacterium]